MSPFTRMLRLLRDLQYEDSLPNPQETVDPGATQRGEWRGVGDLSEAPNMRHLLQMSSHQAQ